MTLKVGDVVELKTGGPRMTVNRIGLGHAADGDSMAMVEAVWFEPFKEGDGNKIWNGPLTGEFGADALNKIDDTPAQREAA